MALPDFFTERVTTDVRQQMEGVLALTEQLARCRLTPDAEACVASVAEAAEGVRRMIASAVDLRTLTHKGITLDPTPTPLRGLMDEVQDRWQPRAQAAGVRLLVSYDGDPEAAVLADRPRLLQIFDGFIAEAVGGQTRGVVEASLQATTSAEGVTLQCRVRGAREARWGDLDLEARIMSIDARMGLEVAIAAAISRQVLTRMGGEVRSGENAGAAESGCFELTLPAVQAEAPEPAGEAPGRAAHVLVVDDNATNRMVAQSLVEMFDCTSEAAEDGVEAVEAARTGRFDLILMDIRMPRMDGVAATRAIRALPGDIGGVPIIALTANADPEDAESYLAAGMNGVVEKPMKPEQLLNALQQALDGGPAARAA